ncbi:MAG: ABC transporter substrate-binding protein, partial [Pseudomonadota bacterium]
MIGDNKRVIGERRSNAVGCWQIGDWESVIRHDPPAPAAENENRSRGDCCEENGLAHGRTGVRTDAPVTSRPATGPLEKTKLNVGFVPITCATPIIMSEPLGFYAKYGFKARVVKMP